MISSNFTKPHLDYSAQVELMVSRGMIVTDKELAVKKLEHINYYRLSAYFLPFQSGKDQFNPDTRFEEVLGLYYFDKALRKIIFDAIETMEINFRANISYHLSMHTGAFGYMDKENLHIGYSEYIQLIQSIQRETSRSKEAFVTHFKKKYRSEILPVWMMVEIISFSTLSKLFKALKSEHETMTQKLEIPPKVLKNWLHVINHLRNICAHHSRVWNKQFVIKAQLPKKVTRFKSVSNDKVFVVVLMLSYIFRKLDTANGFEEKIKTLLAEYPDIDLRSMGFTEDWQERLCS